MGADMLLACTEVPMYAPECASILYRLHPNRQLLDNRRGPSENDALMRLLRTVVHTRVTAWERELEAQEVYDLVERYDSEFEFDDVPGMELDARLVLRNSIMRALEEVFVAHNRETVEFELGGRTYVFSGGLSWGDPPTDAYEQIELLDQSGVTSKIITLEEAESALAKIEAEDAEKAKEKS